MAAALHHSCQHLPAEVQLPRQFGSMGPEIHERISAQNKQTERLELLRWGPFSPRRADRPYVVRHLPFHSEERPNGESSQLEPAHDHTSEKYRFDLFLLSKAFASKGALV